MKKSRTLSESFFYAISGIFYAVKTQRNIKIHFVAAALIIFFSFLLKLNNIELLILALTIALVLTAEMINTAIEIVVDMFTKEYHPLAKAAKNVAAGAVLISALSAVIVGYLIFYDKIAILLKILKR
ncbi:MAG TPA: diacylglycerol kinase family protein [Thermoanaerobacterales bacterium]|uniref:diacylglycerol kinase family protein n=1 Tax=Tepidanaerobacter sp. GT38 TaxID=2722793 RepID=UPI0017901940|nr:diacylglycerol kinase family protein [Tepidanaerobacter sp. GT38]MCG1012718.1 diacylglycerol kinase family protein [Tepidanaerobacter sp. GT38]HHY42632.1 diacylglycerol kinase family protein [Thermoanaerobacterales bacterium]